MQPIILLIEDNSDILYTMNYLLKADGYNVITHPNGDILQNIDDVRPHLVILDEQLSEGKAGGLLCRQLKSGRSTAAIPVILMSGHPKLQEIAEFAGADAYIEKPFDIEGLIDIIRKVLYSTKQ